MKILALSGSPALHSRSNGLLHHLIQRVQADSRVQVSTVRVRDLPAEALLGADVSEAQLAQALLLVAQADVVVIATPIYKAAYSGLLKAFLDLLPQDGLNDKAVIALATGGSPAHFLAIDYALKPVLSALGCRQVVDTVYASDSQLHKLADGLYAADADLNERLGRAASRLKASHQNNTPALRPAATHA